MRAAAGDIFTLPDGTVAIVDRIVDGVAEVIPAWRARRRQHTLVLPLDAVGGIVLE